MTLAGAFVQKAEIELRLRGGDPARAVLDTARALLPPQARMARQRIAAYTRMYQVVGQPAATIEGTFWYNVDHVADGGRVPRPAKGKMTMVSIAPHFCGADCRDRYRGMARYTARFGARGFEVVNLAKTVGFYADTAPVTPAAEAPYDSTYFLGKVRLPGALTVYETAYAWIPDGRRRNAPTPNEAHYGFATVILIDKQGIVRYVNSDWDTILEEPLAVLLERTLGESP